MSVVNATRLGQAFQELDNYFAVHGMDNYLRRRTMSVEEGLRWSDNREHWKLVHIEYRAMRDTINQQRTLIKALNIKAYAAEPTTFRCRRRLIPIVAMLLARGPEPQENMIIKHFG